ncbi:hypothetical protein FS837_002959 [Tulasnella sp. UAMH 9824]|nr:hypothetical protein FS837_002959 [Tulasnella sp. UAMH 9824]
MTGTGMMTIVKLLTNQDATMSDAERKRPHLPTSELIAARMLITWIVAETWMWHKRVPYPILGPPGVRGWLNFRGIVGFFGLFGGYYSVQYISLSDATVIGFLSPFATAFLGRIILKEAFSRKEACAAARPSFLFGHPAEIDPTADTHHHSAAGSADGGIVHGVGGSSQKHIDQSDKMRLIAVCVSLLGVVGASLAMVSMRRLKDSIHVMHSIIYFTSWCLIISTLSPVLSNIIPGIPEASKVVWLWPDFEQLMGIIGIGILGFIGQVLLTMGFQKEAAGRGTLALYLAIVFSLISERIFFHHQPGVLSLFGIAIILSSAIYVVLSKTTDKSASTTTEADEEVGLMPIGSESEDDDGEVNLRGDESSERVPKAEGLK